MLKDTLGAFLSLNLKFKFRMTSPCFKPSKSHNRLTRIWDIAHDPIVIHEIWKRLFEGTVLQAGSSLCSWLRGLDIWCKK